MNKHFGKRTFFFCTLFSLFITSHAQVNTVEFGKNRVQFQKFNWKYYQSENFNTYFSQDGLELGKYVAQVAEKELPELEEFIEYGSQRRINVVVYNNYDEYQQSNVGLGIDWQSSSGLTKLVNNKMLVYFDGNHENLRRAIRQGIAGVLLQNVLFGDDLGEFAANQALLDLPKWLTDGYIEYAAETWSTDLDDQLKSALLSGRYTNFYHFAFERPVLAGHSFLVLHRQQIWTQQNHVSVVSRPHLPQPEQCLQPHCQKEIQRTAERFYDGGVAVVLQRHPCAPCRTKRATLG
jgi:hypothetical protein